MSVSANFKFYIFNLTNFPQLIFSYSISLLWLKQAIEIWTIVK